MNINYRKLPLGLRSVIEGNKLPACDLTRSIWNNIDLIIMTKFGEHRSDPGFGCEIWDLDFELIVSETLWEEKLRQSLLKSISSHERRLINIQLTITISEFEKILYFRQSTEMKKRVDIALSGTINKTGETFNYKTNLFLSPLSAG